MKKNLTCLLFAGGLAGAVVYGQGTDLPPVKPNDINGAVHFSNASPDILALLADVGKLGPKYGLVDATSIAPFEITAQKGIAYNGGASLPYSITVKGSKAPGIGYTVSQRIDLGPGDYATQYYFEPKVSSPVLDNDTPVVLNFDECAGLFTLKWVNAKGEPVIVKDANVSLSAEAGGRPLGGIIHLPSPASSHQFLAGDVGAVTINLSYQVTIPGSSDTVTYSDSKQAKESPSPR